MNIFYQTLMREKFGYISFNDFLWNALDSWHYIDAIFIIEGIWYFDEFSGFPVSWFMFDLHSALSIKDKINVLLLTPLEQEVIHYFSKKSSKCMTKLKIIMENVASNAPMHSLKEQEPISFFQRNAAILTNGLYHYKN